jgi:thioredoxin
MRKITIPGKMTTVIVLVCAALFFYFYINHNDTLFASNSDKEVKDEKGMSVEDFKKKVSDKNKIILVYFYADWCEPCIKLKPEILALEDETKAFCEILRINTDDNPKIADYFEINTLPMFVIYKNGNKSWENIGLLTKVQLQTKLELFK